MEVDASESEVGAMSSQRVSENKVIPACILSCTPAERNDDIGKRGLLDAKLVLEDWWHWLEGAEQPFIVWTDQKNLENIRSAK